MDTNIAFGKEFEGTSQTSQTSPIVYKNDLNFEDKLSVVPTLEESLRQCTEAMKLFTRNEYNKAVNECQKWSKKSLYHLHTQCLMQFVKSILTLEKPEIEATNKVCEMTQEFCSKVRRRGPLNTLTKFVFKVNYNDYSEDEVHSELIYAELQLMSALTTFFGEQSLISLVRGALKLRSSNATYKECLTILERRSQWLSETTKMHFESGIRLGLGALNLVLSHLPQKVLTLLEFIGFSGSYSIGLEYLNQTADNEKSSRQFLAQLLICSYECYMQPLFGLGKGNLDKVQQIVDTELNKFNKSAWFLWFRARILQLNGCIDTCIPVFEECLTLQNELKQLHNIYNWELLWCHAIKCDWHTAANYASILRAQCKWSPATFAYQEASFLYMKMIDNEECPSANQQISDIFRSVPSLRVRYAGKTIPPEKYCLVRTEKYFAQKETLVLPAFEIFYIWNIYSLVSNNLDLIKPILERIEKQIEIFQTKDHKNNCDESLLMLWFMKGICLKEMGLFSKAQHYFEKILENENNIKTDKFLPPEASLELGLTKLKMGSFTEAKYWLEKTRKDYTNYPLETIIHFRVHCALQQIKKQ